MVSTPGSLKGGRRITKGTKVRERERGGHQRGWHHRGGDLAVGGTAGSETRAEQGGAAGSGEETFGRGDGGVGDPRRTADRGAGVSAVETFGRQHGGVGDPCRTAERGASWWFREESLGQDGVRDKRCQASCGVNQELRSVTSHIVTSLPGAVSARL